MKLCQKWRGSLSGVVVYQKWRGTISRAVSKRARVYVYTCVRDGEGLLVKMCQIVRGSIYEDVSEMGRVYGSRCVGM